MAHRYNCITERKEPKPKASERTRYRFRIRHDIETTQDKERFNLFQEAKAKIAEWREKMGLGENKKKTKAEAKKLDVKIIKKGSDSN